MVYGFVGCSNIGSDVATSTRINVGFLWPFGLTFGCFAVAVTECAFFMFNSAHKFSGRPSLQLPPITIWPLSHFIYLCCGHSKENALNSIKQIVKWLNHFFSSFFFKQKSFSTVISIVVAAPPHFEFDI